MSKLDYNTHQRAVDIDLIINRLQTSRIDDDLVVSIDDMPEIPQEKAKQMQLAINNIAPWLSGSLSDPNVHPGESYIQACEDIFKLDSNNPEDD